ncbi:MAG: hypothetical protein V4628_11765 [Pseudomonadota bacterium]
MTSRSIIAAYHSCVGFILLLLLSQMSFAQIQGRLFTTPEERAYLDALRTDSVQRNAEQGFDITNAGPPPLPETEEAAAPAPSIEYTLGGILTRSDGSHTIWLNNQPIAEGSLPSNMKLVMDGAVVVLRITAKAGTFQLKPGQTLNDTTGQIQEAYQRAPALRVETPDAATTALPEQSTIDSDTTDAALPSPAAEVPAEAETRETP